MYPALLAILIAPGFISTSAACQNYGGRDGYVLDSLGRSHYACIFPSYDLFDQAAQDIRDRAR